MTTQEVKRKLTAILSADVFWGRGTEVSRVLNGTREVENGKDESPAVFGVSIGSGVVSLCGDNPDTNPRRHG